MIHKKRDKRREIQIHKAPPALHKVKAAHHIQQRNLCREIVPLRQRTDHLHSLAESAQLSLHGLTGRLAAARARLLTRRKLIIKECFLQGFSY